MDSGQVTGPFKSYFFKSHLQRIFEQVFCNGTYVLRKKYAEEKYEDLGARHGLLEKRGVISLLFKKSRRLTEILYLKKGF